MGRNNPSFPPPIPGLQWIVPDVTLPCSLKQGFDCSTRAGFNLWRLEPGLIDQLINRLILEIYRLSDRQKIRRKMGRNNPPSPRLPGLQWIVPGVT